MTSSIAPETYDIDQEVLMGHSQREMDNVRHARGIENDWLKRPDAPSTMVIPELHRTLFEGVGSYELKGLYPHKPGSVRDLDIFTGGSPPNFYVRGVDVLPAAREYSWKLDSIIQSLPHSPLGHVESVVDQAAWAYYSFIRIHPFLMVMAGWAE